MGDRPEQLLLLHLTEFERFTLAEKTAKALQLAKELALQLEADKHRDQPELLEVQVLNAIEELEK